MDPLSIGSAVVGLIAAAARMAPMLHHFIAHTRDAPKSASQILDEMNSITSALERLQVYLMGAYRTNAARRSMLSLRNIVATLTACVTTYSDLEHIVGKCVSDGQVRSFKWVLNEGDVGELLGRVQAHKLSLVFMLTILQCESMQEAEDNMNRLVELIEGLVDSNADLRNRLDVIAADHDSGHALASRSQVAASHATSTTSINRAFEEDLNSSRVYRNLRPRDSIYSLNSSQRASLALSAFSDLSLGNVSVISVLCLPVWSVDLVNAEHYRFGRHGLTLTMTELAERYPHIDFPDPESTNSIEMRSLYEETSDSELYTQSTSAIEIGVGSETDVGTSGNKSPSRPTPLSARSIFNSALPISSSPPSPRGPHIDSEGDEPEVLFLVASIFEFNIAHTRMEGGVPYLSYASGEIFDVIGMKGELWLARNQDDPKRTVGWIWEKHFARLTPDKPTEAVHKNRRADAGADPRLGVEDLHVRDEAAEVTRARSKGSNGENKASSSNHQVDVTISASGHSGPQSGDRQELNYRGRYVTKLGEGAGHDGSTRSPRRRRRWYEYL